MEVSNDGSINEKQYCRLGYPKPLCSKTYVDKFGHIQYKRSTADSIRCVPHNKFLTYLFKCHINIEYVNDQSVLPYLFKYIFKGSDQSATIKSNVDEIQKYLNGRYISVEKAAVRLLKIPMVKTSLQVVRIDINLPKNLYDEHFRNYININECNDNVEGNDNIAVFEGEDENELDEDEDNNGNNNDVANVDIQNNVDADGDFEVDLENNSVDTDDENGQRFNNNEMVDEINYEENYFILDENKKFPLIEFFKLNAENREIREMNLTYEDFHQHYYFNNKKWMKRRNNRKFITRFPVVTPQRTEGFSFILLLKFVKSPTSLSDLKICPDGSLATTFQEACQKHNLLSQENSIWSLCFEEIQNTATPDRLKTTFSIFLNNSTFFDENATDLFNKYFEFMTLNLLEYLNTTYPNTISIPQDPSQKKDFLKTALLISLNHQTYDFNFFNFPSKLSDYYKECNNFYSSMINKTYLKTLFDAKFKWLNKYEINQLLTINKIKDHPNIQTTINLNNEQQHAFDEIIANSHQIYYLNGCAGSGKSFLLNSLIRCFLNQKKKFLVCASTGIAATNLLFGKTSHKTFSIPIDNNEKFHNEESKKLFKKISDEFDILIFDEISMSHKKDLEYINVGLKIANETNDHMGGKTIIFSGDIKQLPPVSTSNTSSISPLLNSFYSTPLFTDSFKLELNLNNRIKDNEPHKDQYLSFLNELRQHSTTDFKIPSFLNKSSDSNDLISSIYDEEYLKRYTQYRLEFDFEQLLNYFSKSQIITPTNANANILNDQALIHFSNNISQQPIIEVSAYDYYLNPNEDTLTPLNSPLESQVLNQNDLPPSTLKLSVGAPILITRNLNPKMKISNGTKMIIKKISKNVIQAVYDFMGKPTNFDIPRIEFKNDFLALPNVLIRKQFPIKLAFASTVHKSQGLSIENLGIDLTSPIFAHGQAYVAFSRASSIKNIHLLFNNDQNTNNQNDPNAETFSINNISFDISDIEVN